MGKKKKQEKPEKLKKKDKLKKQEKPEKKEKQSKAERRPAKPEKEKAKKEKAGSEKSGSTKVGNAKTGNGKVRNEKTTNAKAGNEKTGKKAVDRPKTERAGRKPGGRRGTASDSMRIAADRFRALGDENRLRILALLEERELCAGDLLKSLSIVQSTLSHHMKILVESGLVACRKQGKWSYYSVSRDVREELDDLLNRWTQD